MESRFSEIAPVKVRLLQGAIYSDEEDLWRLTLAHQDNLRVFFLELGQDVLIDEAEGYACLDQMDLENEKSMFQLFQRRALSFETTILLVTLREELLRFDSTPRTVESIPTVKQEWLVEQLSAYFPEQNNAVKRKKAMLVVVNQAVQLGVLRPVKTSDPEPTYQIMRIVKAKLPEAKISEIRKRLGEDASEHQNTEDSPHGDDATE